MQRGKTSPSGPRITIIKDGPYLVTGSVPLFQEEIETDMLGRGVRWANKRTLSGREICMLCRCGKSTSTPYCDNTHERTGFDGTETASRTPYDEAAVLTTGPDLILADVKPLCAGARFCELKGGTRKLTEKSDDPAARATAIQQAEDCPSGRIEARHKETGAPLDPRLDPAISLVEDPVVKVSGPLWVKGNIPIESADGGVYEPRNRVTLCRCGASKNKPFCDGSHILTGFKTGFPGPARADEAENQAG